MTGYEGWIYTLIDYSDVYPQQGQGVRARVDEVGGTRVVEGEVTGKSVNETTGDWFIDIYDTDGDKHVRVRFDRIVALERM